MDNFMLAVLCIFIVGYVDIYVIRYLNRMLLNPENIVRNVKPLLIKDGSLGN